MINVNLAFRKALVTAMPFIAYKSVNVPVHEEFVQYTTDKPKCILTIGNMQVELYILLQNQTANDDSAKCMRDDIVSIQTMITAVFPANKGGSITTEEISEVLMNTVSDGFLGQIQVVGGDLWRLWVDSYINLQYDTSTNRVWSTIVTLNGNISQ